MQLLETIEYSPQTLNCQKVIEVVSGQIEFYETYIKYGFNFYAEEWKDCEDKELGSEPIERNYSSLFWRKHIRCIEKEWIPKSKLWLVQLQVNGMATDARFYFKKESDADKLHEKFLSYVESI